MKKIIYLIVLSGVFLFSFSAHAGAYSDFFNAIRLDNASALQTLLQRGMDPNTVDADGTPGLIKALQEQSFKAAAVLAGHPQVQPNVLNRKDETPLMLAALRGQEALVIQLLLKGAEVNKKGWSPLHYAATGGHARISAILLGVHADVNAESPNGTTPLMMAAMYGNSDTVKVLLNAGAETYPVNDLGLTAEDFAIKAGREDALRLIRQSRR